jgi:hypothetical protein
MFDILATINPVYLVNSRFVLVAFHLLASEILMLLASTTWASKI